MYKNLECRRNGSDLTFESRRNRSRRNGSRRNGSGQNGNRRNWNTPDFQPFICGSYVGVLYVSCHLSQFELRVNHFSFFVLCFVIDPVNILCSFNVMIPLSLRKSFTLVPYTLQFVLPLKINSTSKFDF